ncbi:hypothetical protein WH47_01853 [Habropoda laboriosa]|uniref:Uncharacterized protein n=1 Tax=Habropoda laboriosa TaxID=597456 RepID=A0A0L7QUC3_9HYME|nr:hypothetical protein WH47_01853 [Habropoda laboriosa]
MFVVTKRWPSAAPTKSDFSPEFSPRMPWFRHRCRQQAPGARSHEILNTGTI